MKRYLVIFLLFILSSSTWADTLSFNFKAVPYIAYRSFGKSLPYDNGPQLGIEFLRPIRSNLEAKIGFGYIQTFDGQDLMGLKSMEVALLRTLPKLIKDPNIEMFWTTGLVCDSDSKNFSLTLGFGGRFLNTNKANMITRVDSRFGSGSLYRAGFERPVSINHEHLAFLERWSLYAQQTAKRIFKRRKKKTDAAPKDVEKKEEKTQETLHVFSPPKTAPLYHVIVFESSDIAYIEAIAPTLLTFGYSPNVRKIMHDSAPESYQLQVHKTFSKEEADSIRENLLKLGFPQTKLVESDSGLSEDIVTSGSSR